MSLVQWLRNAPLPWKTQVQIPCFTLEFIININAYLHGREEEYDLFLFDNPNPLINCNLMYHVFEQKNDGWYQERQ